MFDMFVIILNEFITIIIIILLKAILILFNITSRRSFLHEFGKELSMIFRKIHVIIFNFFYICRFNRVIRENCIRTFKQ